MTYRWIGPVVLAGSLAAAHCGSDKPAQSPSTSTETTSGQAVVDPNATHPPTNTFPAHPTATANRLPGTTEPPGHAPPGGPEGPSTWPSLAPTPWRPPGATPQGGAGGETPPAPTDSSKADQAPSGQAPSATTPSAPDAATQGHDHGRALTATDQGASEADRKITATIRRAIVGDKSLSFSAKNVTIVTIGGKVTLRGQVNSVQEKSTIEFQARQTTGVTDVDNQLEVKK